MPMRIEMVNLPEGVWPPHVQEQREVWWFDPATVVQVPASSTRWRMANGSVIPVPALLDGNLTAQACDFAGQSYQNLAVVFPTPVDWVSITAANIGRVPQANITHAGSSVAADIASQFNNGPVTRHFRTFRRAGDFVIGTAAGAGALKFYEIRGWRER